MRWANLLFFCLFLALSFAGASAPLLAADAAQSRKVYPNERLDSEDEAQDVGDFCYEQRRICRKICTLRSRFEDRFDGCPSSCDSRETRCVSSACYRWSEPEFLIAERFGGFKCAQ